MSAPLPHQSIASSHHQVPNINKAALAAAKIEHNGSKAEQNTASHGLPVSESMQLRDSGVIGQDFAKNIVERLENDAVWKTIHKEYPNELGTILELLQKSCPELKDRILRIGHTMKIKLGMKDGVSMRKRGSGGAIDATSNDPDPLAAEFLFGAYAFLAVCGVLVLILTVGQPIADGVSRRVRGAQHNYGSTDQAIELQPYRQVPGDDNSNNV